MPCSSWTKRAWACCSSAPEGVLQRRCYGRRYPPLHPAGRLPLDGPGAGGGELQPIRAAHGGAGARPRRALLEHGIGALPLLDKRGRVAGRGVRGRAWTSTHIKKHALPVVIMAGGLGTRLYPYTKILPKPLIPVGEMPIVEHIIHRFADVGCSAFTMIVNYKKSMIKSYFNDLQKDYTVDYVDEDTPLGTGGGLSLLKGKVTQTFFLTNCDILIDADFGDIYQYHKEKGNVITMVCAVKHFTIPYGVVELGGDGDISGITRKAGDEFPHEHGCVCGGAVRSSTALRTDEPIRFYRYHRGCARRGRARGRVSREREQLDGYGPAGGAGQHAPPFGDAVGRRGITQAAAPGKARKNAAARREPGGQGEIICQCSSSRRRA